MDAHIDLRAGGFRALSVTALRRIGRVENGMDWLRGLDLNQRPLGYEPNELPDCSTPHCQYTQSARTCQRFFWFESLEFLPSHGAAAGLLTAGGRPGSSLLFPTPRGLECV